jgi:hypothetical protein
MNDERAKLIKYIESKKELVCIAEATIHGLTTHEDVKNYFNEGIDFKREMSLAITRTASFYEAKKVVVPSDIYDIMYWETLGLCITNEGILYLYDASQDLRTLIILDPDVPSIKFYK